MIFILKHKSKDNDKHDKSDHHERRGDCNPARSLRVCLWDSIERGWEGGGDVVHRVVVNVVVWVVEVCIYNVVVVLNVADTSERLV